MAPKRQRKSNIVVEKLNKYENILISDALCPICRSILIEPVTLPCNHGFCLSCFNGTMENNSLTCPLCRIRIGSWLRTARKENRVINDIFWKTLQHKFPNEIQKKKEGEDFETNDKLAIRIADPGEIRQEYEIQLAKEQSELQREKQAEETASRIAIERIIQEEQEKAKLNEEKLRLDEEIAKRLANELSDAGPSNAVTVPVKLTKKGSIDKYFMTMKKQKSDKDSKNSANFSQNSQIKNQVNLKLANKYHTTNILNQNKDKSCSAAYKHLLLTKTLQREQNNSNGSDSGDSIKQEMRYFKPIRTAPKSVPKLQSDGNISIVPLIKVPAVLPKAKQATIKKPNVLNLKTISNENSAFANVSPTNISLCHHAKSAKTESIYRKDENGKIIKQYYNQKRSYMKELNSNNSGPSSPVLGFEKTSNKSDILSALVNSLSANLNGESSSFKNVINNNNKEEKVHVNNSKRQMTRVNKAVCDQEKEDLEFARKLHEELNNPRFREYSTRSQRKTTNVTNGKCRKRQVTLEELVTTKKFKI